MKATIASALPIQDPGTYRTPPATAPGPSTTAKESPRQNADLRLVIEEDPASGTFVYKTLDRRTGEVVRQLPREEVVKLKDALGYSPGEVTDSRS
jgi:flagellar protein FlaG